MINGSGLTAENRFEHALSPHADRLHLSYSICQITPMKVPHRNTTSLLPMAGQNSWLRER